MKKQFGMILAVAVVAILLTTGCIGGGDETGDAGDSSDIVEFQNGAFPEKGGWVDGSDPTVTLTVPTGGGVISMTINVAVRDSNEEHAETDDGSEPDKISITMQDGGEFSKKESISAPGNTNWVEKTFTYKTNEESLFGSIWSIKLTGSLGSGKPAYFLGFIIYVDQGFEYKVSASYEYVPGTGGAAAPAAA